MRPPLPFSLLLALLSLRTTMGGAGSPLIPPPPPRDVMLASDVRGSRLLAAADAPAGVPEEEEGGRPLLLWLLDIELASPLTRRGRLVWKLLSRLRGRYCGWWYLWPSRSTGVGATERRGLAATSMRAFPARLARLRWVGVCGKDMDECRLGGV